MSEKLGHLHFWPSLICMNGIFIPMFIQGMAGVSRRLYDGGASYTFAKDVLYLNEVSSMFAWALGLSQIPFMLNIILTLTRGKKVEENPWHATTVEWACPSPPGHGNFTQPITVYRDPYEYSVPGSKQDFTPQSQKEVT